MYNNQYHLNEQKKPDESIDAIIKVFNHHRRRLGLKRDILVCHDIIFLHEGAINVRRTTDELIVLRYSAPLILGLEQLFIDDEYSLSFEKNSIYSIVPKSIFFNKIEQLNLWKGVSEILAYHIHLLNARDGNVIKKTKYEMIKAYLLEVWNLEANEREQISLYDYILSRANVSRSTLYKIILELNKGGYIYSDRGVLKDIKKLPDKF
ncbi:helix-turn-helix domain-containing protein [Enterobacter asburiae]|uniref:helix-turn-helix domain-containing protein n=1 Tax=Enterobacter asburiae TaxID=61645 RepID=UPI00192A92CA|nr:helix-turn-helix domain-containing protein [Enterobacter asburiae]MBL5950342.1 helix-turn-helix domain-containing protein [Enterobacter asburiae]